MRRLASALATVMLAACAVDPSADVSNDQGGGKADDTCESGAYKTWLSETYLPTIAALGQPLSDANLEQALTAAAAMPCTTGSDADFALWFQVFDNELAPVVSRLAAPAARTQAEYDAHVAAAVITAAEQNTLTALLAASPNHTGAAGYARWIESYDKVLRSAFTGAAAGQLVFENNAIVNDAELPVLKALEDARPTSSQELAYATWFPKYMYWHATGFAPLAEPSYRNFTSRMVLQRPTARADKDYLTFFVTFETTDRQTYETATASTPRAIAALDAIAVVHPQGLTAMEIGGGSRSFGPWFSAFVERFGAAIGSDLVITEAEKARLDRFITTKPCTTDVAADSTPWENLNARRANFGATASYLDAAKPVACAE